MCKAYPEHQRAYCSERLHHPIRAQKGDMSTLTRPVYGRSEMCANKASLRRPDHIREGIKGGFRDAFHALEMAQQRLFRAGTYPLDGGKLTDDGRLRPAVAMMGDTETVSLVAKLLHYPE